MARIAVGGFQHETNSFAPEKADFRRFEMPDAWPGLQRGKPLLEAFPDMNIAMSGALGVLKAAGHELIPLVWASATPSAPVTQDAYERITAMMLADLAEAGPVDGIYLDLHGAMIAEHLDDGEGELLTRIRGLAGDGPVIVASLDLHANVTAAMVGHADLLESCREYPHVDLAETGERAARHLLRMLASGTKDAKAFEKLDFLSPLPAQCTLIEPAKGLYAELARTEGTAFPSGQVTAMSFCMAFGPADLREAGPAVMAYGTTLGAAKVAAHGFARAVAAKEKDFVSRIYSPADAVAEAIALPPGKPVVLADPEDNPGAGGNGDTVGLLKALLAANASALLGVMYDPETAAQAHQAGLGALITVSLGAKSGGAPEEPVRAEAKVLALTDGRVKADGPFYRGSLIQLGPAARLGFGPVEVVVASNKVQCADRAMLAHTGADLMAYQILGVKSGVHFRADFGPIAEAVLIVSSPGPAPLDLTGLPFKRLRPGIRLMPMGRAFTPG